VLGRRFSPDETQGFGAIDLRGEGARVVILPAIGGKISALELGGRQWLWRSTVIPFRPGVDGTSYVKSADSGGYDECFPTVSECNVPSHIPRYGGLALPDHGELWSQPVSCTTQTLDEGLSCRCEWLGRRMSYRFGRTVLVSGGRVEMRYDVSNQGNERLPFLWSAHPLFPLTSKTRIELPENARTRIWAQHHIDVLAGGREQRWPRLRTAKGPVDASRPASMARKFACKIFLDMPVGRAALIEDGARLEVEFDTKEVPNFGLWLNNGGWHGAGRSGYHNLAFEPCIGAPDSLAEAIGGWDSSHWLAPGERRQWSLWWKGGAPPATAPVAAAPEAEPVPADESGEPA
jgi:hypothetical protein